jgi:hypothetical protein
MGRMGAMKTVAMIAAGALLGGVAVVYWFDQHPPAPLPAKDPSPEAVRATLQAMPLPEQPSPDPVPAKIDPPPPPPAPVKARERRATPRRAKDEMDAVVEAASARVIDPPPAPAPVKEEKPRPTPEQLARSEEALRVLRAIDNVNRVPNSAMTGPINALKQVKCSTPEISAVRDLCAQLYTALANGSDRHDKTAAEITRREKKTSSHEELAALHEELARADAEADSARRGIDGCVKGVFEIKARYVIDNDDRL